MFPRIVTSPAGHGGFLVADGDLTDEQDRFVLDVFFDHVKGDDRQASVSHRI